MALVMMKKLVTFPKKEVHSTKKTRSNNVIKIDKNTTLLEALVKGGYITSHKAEDGKVKMRILVNKHDLKQLLETMMNNENNGTSKVLLPKASPLPEVERRLRDLMKRKRATNAKGRQSSTNWRPALQSIPEEH
uniref:Uncharacterized protein n=1 Tax=Chenopodium quinoa TaxID=63459 RepID=A0A803LGA1_CHEQI